MPDFDYVQQYRRYQFTNVSLFPHYCLCFEILSCLAFQLKTSGARLGGIRCGFGVCATVLFVRPSPVLHSATYFPVFFFFFFWHGSATRTRHIFFLFALCSNMTVVFFSASRLGNYRCAIQLKFTNENMSVVIPVVNCERMKSRSDFDERESTQLSDIQNEYLKRTLGSSSIGKKCIWWRREVFDSFFKSGIRHAGFLNTQHMNKKERESRLFHFVTNWFECRWSKREV